MIYFVSWWKTHPSHGVASASASDNVGHGRPDTLRRSGRRCRSAHAGIEGGRNEGGDDGDDKGHDVVLMVIKPPPGGEGDQHQRPTVTQADDAPERGVIPPAEIVPNDAQLIGVMPSDTPPKTADPIKAQSAWLCQNITSETA